MNSNQSGRKLKVLLLASDCNPQWHSLPALIAEYYSMLSRYVEITLVTHVRNRENLTGFLPKGAEVVYLDTEVIAKPFYLLTKMLTRDPNKAMTLQVALSYPGNIYFEYCAWKRFKHALKAGEYDIVHRASPMSPTIPSPMAKWSPVPFVIGPVLGGLPWPEDFKGEMRREGEWMNYFRAAHTFLPYYRSTYKHAAAILAGYAHTVGDIPKPDHGRVIEFSEGGIHPEDFPERTHVENERRQFLFVGRMVPFKQPELLVRCFIESDVLKKHKLVIVGDGPELPRLRALVEEHNLSDCVELTGTVPVERVRELMYESEVFAFPSIREQGGGVLTMASMSSTPCIVVDYGGPSVRVQQGRGVKVPLGDYQSILKGFIKEMEALANDPERCREMGLAAREYTQKYYSWQWKATKTVEIYEWVLGKRKNKPVFRADPKD